MFFAVFMLLYQSKYLPYIMFILLAIFGAIAVFYITANGINLLSDSVTYLQTADNISKGIGAADYPGYSLDPIPLTHFPPLYPAILSVFSGFGGGMLAAARWVNIAAGAVLVYLMGNIVYSSSKSLAASFLAAVFTLSSSTMAMIHASALTEPIFIVFTLAGFMALARHIKKRSLVCFVLAIVFAALAALSRYVGAAVIIAGSLAILLWKTTPFRSRVFDSFLFSGLSFLPMGLWLARNYAVSGALTDRVFSFHFLSAVNLFEFFTTLTDWVFPYWRDIEAGAVIFTIIVLSLGFYARRRKGEKKFRVTRLLLLFAFVYLGFVVFSIIFFDALTPLNFRILSPVYFVMVIFMFVLAAKYTRYPHVFAALGLYVLIVLASAAYSAVLIRSRGIGFTSRYIAESGIKEQIEKISLNQLIYTNVPHAVYVLSGRPAFHLPPKGNPHARLARGEYGVEISDMVIRVERQSAVILYITLPAFYDPRMLMPAADEIYPLFDSNLKTEESQSAIKFFY